MVKIRDRIVGLKRVKASELLPNPKNWRTHPESQQNALRGVLSEIGYADALIARKLYDGSLMLIDGHLRAETSGDEKVPVLVVDVTEAEADKILLTLDPLAGLATRDDEKLKELIGSVTFDSEALRQLMDSLDASEWLGEESELDIPDYSEESETVSVRVNECPRSVGDELGEAIQKLLDERGLPLSVVVM